MNILCKIGAWIATATTVVCTATVSFAQDRDTQLWADFGIDVPIAKRLTALGKQEFRLYDDVSTLSLYRTELGLEYKLFSFMKISAVYRLDAKPDDVEHTVHINSTMKADVGPLELSWRLRLLRDFVPDGSPEDVVRNKFGLDFEGAGSVTPYVAAEVYYYTDGKKKGFNRFRWYAGLKRDIDKYHSVQLYYLLQRELGGKRTELTTVLGLSYGYSL